MKYSVIKTLRHQEPLSELPTIPMISHKYNQLPVVSTKQSQEKNIKIITMKLLAVVLAAVSAVRTPTIGFCVQQSSSVGYILGQIANEICLTEEISQGQINQIAREIHGILCDTNDGADLDPEDRIIVLDLWNNLKLEEEYIQKLCDQAEIDSSSSDEYILMNIKMCGPQKDPYTAEERELFRSMVERQFNNDANADSYRAKYSAWDLRRLQSCPPDFITIEDYIKSAARTPTFGCTEPNLEHIEQEICQTGEISQGQIYRIKQDIFQLICDTNGGQDLEPEEHTIVLELWRQLNLRKQLEEQICQINEHLNNEHLTDKLCGGEHLTIKQLEELRDYNDASPSSFKYPDSRSRLTECPPGFIKIEENVKPREYSFFGTIQEALGNFFSGLFSG